MTLKLKGKLLFFAKVTLFSVSTVSFANSDTSGFAIPMIDDAKVFADFSDKMPAVVNYFTSSSEEQIIAFYQESFGDATFQERKRGRLITSYQQADYTMRVVISQQDNKRQVDVMVE